MVLGVKKKCKTTFRLLNAPISAKIFQTDNAYSGQCTMLIMQVLETHNDLTDN